MIEGRDAGHSLEKEPAKFGLIWLSGFCDITIQMDFDQHVVKTMKNCKNLLKLLINDLHILHFIFTHNNIYYQAISVTLT